MPGLGESDAPCCVADKAAHQLCYLELMCRAARQSDDWVKGRQTVTCAGFQELLAAKLKLMRGEWDGNAGVDLGGLAINAEQFETGAGNVLTLG